jgi:hypothetical protein
MSTASFTFASDSIGRIARWGGIAATLIALSIAVYLVLSSRRVPPQQRPRLDPTRPVVEVSIPLASLTARRTDAFVLPDEVIVPPRAIVRIKGKFHTGKRSGGTLVVAEAKVASKTGKMALLCNGLKGVQLNENAICEFELLIHFPKNVRPGIVDFKVGDEFLATASFKPGP